MLTIQVEGIYESDIGSGQKKYENFNYKIEISRQNERGVVTHIMRRFIPYLIYKDKTKSGIAFSRLKTFCITDIKKTDTQSKLIGKNIDELSEFEIQDLACLFDLYEVPLPLTCSITELRESAILAYMKKVLKISMETEQEKQQLAFLEKQPDGSYKLHLDGEKVIVEIPNGYFEKQEAEKEIQKKGLSFFQNLTKTVKETILTESTNKEQNKKTDGNFPDIKNLLQNQQN